MVWYDVLWCANVWLGMVEPPTSTSFTQTPPHTAHHMLNQVVFKQKTKKGEQLVKISMHERGEQALNWMQLNLNFCLEQKTLPMILFLTHCGCV